MELKELVKKINEALNEDACSRESIDVHYVSCRLFADNWNIDVEEERKPIKGEAPIRVYIKHDGKTDCENLIEFIENHVGVDWDTADDVILENNSPRDVWDEHGFADEADYIHWRYH